MVTVSIIKKGRLPVIPNTIIPLVLVECWIQGDYCELGPMCFISYLPSHISLHTIATCKYLVTEVFDCMVCYNFLTALSWFLFLPPHNCASWDYLQYWIKLLRILSVEAFLQLYVQTIINSLSLKASLSPSLKSMFIIPPKCFLIVLILYYH